MKKTFIIEYDESQEVIKETTNYMGDKIIYVKKRFYTCDCCGGKVTKENWGGHILKPIYRNKRKSIIYKREQKDFVCNVCLSPEVRQTMRVLGLGNRK